MVKFNRMFSSLFIATELVFVAYSYCHASIGDPVASRSLESNRWQQIDRDRFSLSWQTNDEAEPPKPPINAGTNWADVLPPPPKDEENTGVRGGFCPIAPGRLGTTQMVWNDRPLFLWDETRGNVTRVEVRDSSDMQNSTLLWSAEPTENQAQYDGEALEPGQIYYWQVFLNGANQPTMSIPFQIAPDRDRIAIELATLVAELPSEADAEDVARTRARYFAENELPSDALLEAFTVIEPSQELAEILETLPQEYCRGSED